MRKYHIDVITRLFNFKPLLLPIILMGAIFGTSPDHLLAQEQNKEKDRQNHLTLKGNWDRHTHTTNSGAVRTEIEYEGEIVFNDTDTDVIKISRDGYLRISRRTFGTTRRAMLRGRSNNEIERQFYIGNREEPWEPEGAKWFSDVLPDVIRSTGIGAEQRVMRFYRKGGIDAVTNEIDLITSDYIKGIYYAHAIEIDGIKVNDLNKVIVSASRKIDSDYELSKFLRNGARTFTDNSSNITAVLQGTTEISSDFEKARVLREYLEEDLTTEQTKLVIQATKTINSDFEHARVLNTLLDKNDLSSDQLQLVLDNISTISSDFEKGRVLKKVAEEQELTDQLISNLILASNSISSDFEQAKLLMSLADKELSQDNLLKVAMAVDNIHSSFEQGRLLRSIVANNKFRTENAGIVIKASARITSDFERARILSYIARDELSDVNFEAVLDASDNMSSNYEKSRVIKELIENNDLNKRKALALLAVIEGISSDYEKTTLLIKMGSDLPDDDEVRDRFRKVARSVSSDYDYGRIMRSVDF